LDPLSKMLQDLEATRKTLESIRDVRDDVKTAVAQLKAFNKMAPQLIPLLERLTKVLEKGEPQLSKLVSALENMDKNMNALAKLVETMEEK